MLLFIIFGIWMVIVLIIGMVILVVLIGVGGLGIFILLGIDWNNLLLIFIGVILLVVLVVLFNYGIYWLEKVNGWWLIIGGIILGFLLGGLFFWN